MTLSFPCPDSSLSHVAQRSATLSIVDQREDLHLANWGPDLEEQGKGVGLAQYSGWAPMGQS